MKSMTGFGRSEGLVGFNYFIIEMKSVNHRFLDIRFRLPPLLSKFEPSLFELVRGSFERGSFEITIRHRWAKGESVPGQTRFVVDELAAQSFMDACQKLHQQHKTPKVPSLETLVFANRIVIPVEEADTVEASAYEGLVGIFKQAIQQIDMMRQTEGVKLKAVLEQTARELQILLSKLNEHKEDQAQKIRKRLTQRLEKWSLGSPVDNQRLETEVAFLAERADISEEIERAQIHLQEFLTTCQAPRSLGRKLDFLTQELHREINTVASKAALIEITRVAVEAKQSIEKLREQVQNVE